jgi:hypothetical protein
MSDLIMKSGRYARRPSDAELANHALIEADKRGRYRSQGRYAYAKYSEKFIAAAANEIIRRAITGDHPI